MNVVALQWRLPVWQPNDQTITEIVNKPEVQQWLMQTSLLIGKPKAKEKLHQLLYTRAKQNQDVMHEDE